MTRKIFKTLYHSYVLRRISQMIFALFGLSILIFTIARVLPGDPILLALGPRAPDWARQNLREQLHLDEPIIYQYFFWLRDALSGNLGKSLVTFRSVTADILQFLPATIELVIFAAVIDIFLSITLGVLAGRYANTWIDNAVRGFSYVGVSIPSFVLAIILLLVFGYSFHLIPSGGRLTSTLAQPPVVTGFMTVDSLLAGRFDAFVDALWHLLAPAFAMAAGIIAQEARVTRAGVVENSNKDYIVSATSHGLPERTVVLKYLLKPSLIPTVTIMGLDIATLISSGFLVETIFSWPGFARYGVNAILRKDLNAIVGVVMITGLVFAVANIIVDIVVSYLDPRIRMIQSED